MTRLRRLDVASGGRAAMTRSRAAAVRSTESHRDSGSDRFSVVAAFAAAAAAAAFATANDGDHGWSSPFSTAAAMVESLPLHMTATISKLCTWRRPAASSSVWSSVCRCIPAPRPSPAAAAVPLCSRPAAVAMSSRWSRVRHLHRAEPQPEATVDCMACTWRYEQRESNGWWKGRKSARGGRTTRIGRHGGEGWPESDVK